MHGTKPHVWRVEPLDGMKVRMELGPWAADSVELQQFLNTKCVGVWVCCCCCCCCCFCGGGGRPTLCVCRDNRVGITFGVDEPVLYRLLRAAFPDRGVKCDSAIAAAAEQHERAKAQTRAELDAVAASRSDILRAALREALGASARNSARFIDALMWSGCVAPPPALRKCQ